MSENNKLNVGVLFGGRSAEHEISIITGLEVLNALDPQRYNVFPVYVDSKGRWYSGDALREKSFYSSLPESLKKAREVTLLPVPGIGGLIYREKPSGLLGLFAKEEILPIDVVIPVFHGQFGEDGCIQGLLELADVAYTGCGVLASAAAMNKYHCKSILHAYGIPVLPAVVVNKMDAKKGLNRIREQILHTEGLEKFPLFIKPGNLGSSIGISRVDDAADLDGALAKVFEYDCEAIVEPCVSNLMEVNISVVEGEGGPTASVTEIPVASAGFLTYEDKYLRGGKGKKGRGSQSQGMASLVRVVDPSNLAEETKAAVKQHALEAYKILGCCGAVRFDFIIDVDTNRLYFNELNPLPGSMAYYLWEKSTPALLYPELLNRIIDGALSRHQIKAALKRDLGFRALK